MESELKETKDYYLKRIEALERGNNVFTDTSILIAGESIVEKRNNDHLDYSGPFCANFEEHMQRITYDQREVDQREALRSSQQDRNSLYDKLALAEQVLEQITEELSLLSAENKFLSKLNQRLTYHACRQEKYFIDWRKQSNLKSSHSRSKKTRNGDHLSISQTSAAITTQEIIVDADLTKERVSKIVNDAEHILKSTDRRPRPQPHAIHTKTQSTVDMKYRT